MMENSNTETIAIQSDAQIPVNITETKMPGSEERGMDLDTDNIPLAVLAKIASTTGSKSRKRHSSLSQHENVFAST